MNKSHAADHPRYSEESGRTSREYDRKISIRTTGRTKSTDVFRDELTLDDHILLIPELCERYNTNIKTGLTSTAAAELLLKYGPNAMKSRKSRSKFVIFCEFMFCGFAMLLWAGVFLCLIGCAITRFENSSDEQIDDWDQIYLASVILLVILITGLFGFYQESANSAIMDTFNKMIPKRATVFRDGKLIDIESANLVLGDIVHMNSGDCVPADIRIIEATFLKVDNSSITGESDPQVRIPENTNLNPLETANLAFYGTNVVEGSGRGVVVATGNNTLMGRIAGLTAGLQADMSPIKKELRRFVQIITIYATIAGVIFLILALLANETFIDAFAFFIAIIVANVPEGLLVTMTACLTLTAKRMAKKNCLCKNLQAIETLGSTTVICSDKTGTLTQNRMTVSHIYYDKAIVDILSETYTKSNSSSFLDLCRIGILCSQSEFKPGQEHIEIMQRVVVGDASESAVLKAMEILIGMTFEYRNTYPKIYEIPFNSTNKFQVSIHSQPTSPDLLLVMKGAPEKILDRCSTIASANKTEELTENVFKKLEFSIHELSFMGERVLGFADLILPNSKYPKNFVFDLNKDNVPLMGLRFVGFMSMIDPPRAGVSDAVSICKTAGIKVVMVTGDHPMTAMAIARKIGIISPESETPHEVAIRKNISISQVDVNEIVHCTANVITGTDLHDMNNFKLSDTIKMYDELVFARTSPQQKLMIVEAYQHLNNVVAVTGDGVNDSPALKKADVGIAMGISGSDVSKQAADLIILDDNFASIVVGIEEGRLIFDNLKKSIAYMLTSNIPEMVPFVFLIVLGVPLPLSIIAILVIDVGTDLWPGISLAYEKAETDIMLRKPRNPTTERLVNWKLIWFTAINIGFVQALASLTCYFYVMSDHGFCPSVLFKIGRVAWYSKKNDIKDCYGQEWTLNERMILERKGYSATFLAIVITQVADCIICKTRRLSIAQQGMTNHVMNMGIIFAIAIAVIVVYCPYINNVLRFEPIALYLLLPALPFALIIILFDETRKYIIRKNPGGWVDRETYF